MPKICFFQVFEQKLNYYISSFIVPSLELKKTGASSFAFVKCLSAWPDFKVQITYSAESPTTSGNWQAVVNV